MSTVSPPMPRRVKTAVQALLRFALGVALFAAVLLWLLQASELPQLQFVGLAAAAGLVGSLLANLVTARRWQLLSEAMNPSHLPYGVYFHHLAWTRVLGQFLPSLLVDLVGRSASLRAAGSSVAISRLLAPLLLERILDLLLPLTLLAWTLGMRALGWRGPWAWGSLAAVLVVFAAVSVPLLRPMVALGLRLVTRVRRNSNDETVVPTLSPSLAWKTTGLSLLRYGAVLVQYWGAGAALGASLPIFVLVAAAPVAQLAGLVGITPGALGIQEGGWVGALRWFDESPATIAVFVLATRGAMIVNFSILALASWPWRRVSRPPQTASPPSSSGAS